MTIAVAAACRAVRLADKTFLTDRTVYWYTRGEWRWGPLEAIEHQHGRAVLRVRGQRGVELLAPSEVSA